jgi:hypothetical protein
MSAADIRAQVNLVQEVMQAVMKRETHYGVIPGTKKPSLYKAGAEVLCATFRIADRYEVEDLTVDGMARFRVRCIGTHQTTGVVLGEGMGECSSHEEKYKWRAAICKEEFDATPENMRRIKFSKYQGNVEKKQQVRTEPADQANTILKMACKRAKIAMTLNAVAASDCFTQDIEDLPEELRHDDEPQQRDTSPKAYPDDKFKENLPAWSQLIVTGKKTAEDIIKTVSGKAVLSDDQQAAIRAVKKPDSAPPTVDAEKLAERLRTATDTELLAADADLISAVTDPKKRDELAAIYNQRLEELSA